MSEDTKLRDCKGNALKDGQRVWVFTESYVLLAYVVAATDLEATDQGLVPINYGAGVELFPAKSVRLAHTAVQSVREGEPFHLNRVVDLDYDFDQSPLLEGPGEWWLTNTSAVARCRGSLKNSDVTDAFGILVLGRIFQLANPGTLLVDLGKAETDELIGTAMEKLTSLEQRLLFAI